MSVYSLDDRLEAVRLCLKYDREAAAVMRELGYPSRNALQQWVAGYEATGTLHGGYRGCEPKYPDEQKGAAVEYYLEHGSDAVTTRLDTPHNPTIQERL